MRLWFVALALTACAKPAAPVGPTTAPHTPGWPGPSAGAAGAAAATAATAAPDVPTGAAAARIAELAPRAAGFVDAFVNLEPSFTRDGKGVLFISTRDGLPQLYLATSADAPPARVVTTKERVFEPFAALGGKDVVFMSDVGGDEHWSFFRVGLDGKNLVELTPGPRLQRDGFVIPDGKPSTLFFSARAMAESKTTFYVTSALEPSEPRPLHTEDKPAFLSDVSRDGKQLVFTRFPSVGDNAVVRLDVETGKTRVLYPTEGTAGIFAAKFSRDGKRVLVATDGGAEQALVLALDATTGKVLARHALAPATASVSELAVSKENQLVAVSVSAGNRSEIRLLDARTLKPRTDVQLPLGSGVARAFSPDGTRLAVQWSTPRAPTDLVAVDTDSGKVSSLRADARPSLTAMPDLELREAQIPAFDGGSIPANVYVPKGAKAKLPVLVSYHGGPAGVSVVRWNPAYAFFLSLGYAIVEPNVRGSSGYGRAYEAADNGPRRLDAFRDIESSARWVAAQPWADPARLVVYGGSYGGYTTLVALTRWPDLWRAGVDLFGPSNLRTLMANTNGLVRQILTLELGDPDKDAAFLDSISPIHDVAKIVDPLFVYAGANDPRVPRSESDQIVKAVRGRRVPTEYMVADDEGHSLARRETQIAFYARVARFLEEHLR